MEERSLLIQKYIFPVLIILTGIVLLNTAMFSGTGSTSQSGTFLLGSFVVVIMGMVTILYIKEIITKYSLNYSCLNVYKLFDTWLLDLLFNIYNNSTNRFEEKSTLTLNKV